MLVEVKGPRDRLSDQQKAWLEHLAELGEQSRRERGFERTRRGQPQKKRQKVCGGAAVGLCLTH